MKKIILIATMLFSCTQISAQKQTLNDLFEKYQEAEGVTSIKISKPMFGMLNKLNLQDADLDEIKPLLAKINGLKILIVERPDIKDSLSAAGKKMILNFNNLQGQISSAVKNLKYEELMTVNSKDNKIKFLSAGASSGHLDDLLLSINSGGQNVLLMLDGKLDMDDINKLINEGQKVDKTEKSTN